MKAIKVSVALSGAFCLFILAVLFRETGDGIRHIFGDWTGFVSFLVMAWSVVMMVIGNVGLWFLLNGYKEGVRR